MAITYPTESQNEARLARLGSNSVLSNNGQIQSGNVPDTNQVLNTQVGTNMPTNFSTVSNLLGQNLTQEANRSFFTNESLAGTLATTDLDYQPLTPTTLRPQDYPNLSPSQLAALQSQINLNTDQVNAQQAQLIQQTEQLRQGRVQENADALATTQLAFSVLGGIDPLRSGRNIASLTGNQAKVRQDLVNLFNEATNKQIQLFLGGQQANLQGLQGALEAQSKQEQVDFQQSMALSDRLGTFVDDEGNLQEIAGQVNVPTLQGQENARSDVKLGMAQQAQNYQLLGFATTPDGRAYYTRPDGLPTLNPAEARIDAFGFPELFVNQPDQLQRQQARQGLQAGQQEIALNDIKLQYAPAQQELALEKGLTDLDLNRVQLKSEIEKLKQALTGGGQALQNAQTANQISQNLGNNPINGRTLTNPTYANIEYDTDKQGNITGIKSVKMAENWRDTLLRSGISVGDLENDNALLRKFSSGNDASPVLDSISKFVASTDGQEALRKITFTGTATTEDGKEGYPTDFIAIQTDTGGYRTFAVPRDLTYNIDGEDVLVRDVISRAGNDQELSSLLEDLANETTVSELSAQDFISKFSQTDDAGLETKAGILQMVIGGVAGEDLIGLQEDIPNVYTEIQSIFNNPGQPLTRDTANRLFDDYQNNRLKEQFPDYSDDELKIYREDLKAIINVFNQYRTELKSSYGNDERAKDWYVATVGSLIGGVQQPNFALAETLWNSEIK